MFDKRNVRELQLGTPYNCRTKWYGDEVGQVLVCNRPVFTAGLEKPQGGAKRSPRAEKKEAADPADLERARRRARTKVFDLCYCNEDLNWFWTFTLDKTKVDRYDLDEFGRRLNTWLDNMVRRYGLKYVLVIEQHKDGAYHAHALMNGALKKNDSGTQWKRGEQWRTVWNTPQWKLGFTTGVEMTGERTAYCRYLAKYITKGGKKIGGRYYRHGGLLKTPKYSYCNVDYDSIESERMFEIEGTGVEYKIL